MRQASHVHVRRYRSGCRLTPWTRLYWRVVWFVGGVR